MLLLFVLILPVKFTIKSSNGSDVQFSISILGIKFSSKDKPDDEKKEKKKKEPEEPKKKHGSSAFKKMFGLDKFDSIKTLKTNLSQSGIDGTFGKTIGIIKFLLDELKTILRHIKLKKLRIVYVSADEDAAKTAIIYGTACAAVYPISGYMQSVMKSVKNAAEINLGCDFDAKKPRYEVVVSVSLQLIFAAVAAIKIIKRLKSEMKSDEK